MLKAEVGGRDGMSIRRTHGDAVSPDDVNKTHVFMVAHPLNKVGEAEADNVKSLQAAEPY
jgi:hypothetical protein